MRTGAKTRVCAHFATICDLHPSKWHMGTLTPRLLKDSKIWLKLEYQVFTSRLRLQRNSIRRFPSERGAKISQHSLSSVTCSLARMCRPSHMLKTIGKQWAREQVLNLEFKSWKATDAQLVPVLNAADMCTTRWSPVRSLGARSVA